LDNHQFTKGCGFSATAARLYGNILVTHRFGVVLPGSTSHASLSKLIPSDLAPAQELSQTDVTRSIPEHGVIR
jgi:hypothetical protein